jgi:multidrug efflux pump subunit AcrB
MPDPLGISGRIARRFLDSEITPLLALTGVLLGLFALLVTPREEEPQIDVTFANVFIPYPGASAREVALLVTTPAEQIVSEIEGVEHIYSMSSAGMAVLTVRFEVGEPRTEAIVRLYNAFYSNRDWLPDNAGVGAPLIKPKGIDDVPIVAVTLWSEDPRLGADDLARVAHGLEAELQRVPGARDVETLGAPDRVVHVLLDPQRLAGYGLAVDDLQRALSAANASFDAAGIVSGNREILVQAGTFLTTPEEITDLVVGVRSGAPVYLRDVADVRPGPDQPERYVTHGSTDTGWHPALTLSVSKKPGANAVTVARAVIARLEVLRGTILPDGIRTAVTRDYGATAAEKAGTLIRKLVFATISVIVLALAFLGWRAAVAVGAAVIVTLMLTLFASWAWGFTLNRVSLFALIFSIGILVDDAIVVVENMHRHLGAGGEPATAVPRAVDEVGGPTILATFTVIAALLPMAFVTGLMGPYMRPIPINASTGMLISLAVAFVFTPWLYRRLYGRMAGHTAPSGAAAARRATRVLAPFLGADPGPRRWLLAAMLLLVAGALALVVVRAVVMKMLPFDNKSEFQVLVDMPEGTPVEETQRVLEALARHVLTIPEVLDVQLYAGTSAPINFNGLVRQYYLRCAPYHGDIQVNLVPKGERDRRSHDIAAAARAPLQAIGARHGATVRMVEVPPGPPVLAPLVAEVYGLDYGRQLDVAAAVRRVFERAPEVVDVDDTREAPQEKLIVTVDRARAARLGVSQRAVAQVVAAALGGEDASYLHSANTRTPIPIRIEFSTGAKADPAMLAALRVRAGTGALVPLSEIARFTTTTRDQTIHHKDLLPVVYVTGDVAGKLDSPLYGMRAIASAIAAGDAGTALDQYYIRAPDNPYRWSLKWDGEWQVTDETFRDMGIAYAAGLVIIYLLVVAQFRSYGVPLIIMAPIPLTLAGVLPGHALLGVQFTAPSMIGLIALAGIIVRNSILLVDFIQLRRAAGTTLEQAVIESAAVRARPIALTAAAAMLGGLFILDDPIFGGLAVSLIFGLLVSTLLTLVVIPVLYYAFHRAPAVARP